MPRYQAAYGELMAAKLGLPEADESSRALVDDLLQLMAEAGADYTLTFRRLAELAAPNSSFESVAPIFELPASLQGWLEKWLAKLEQQSESAANRQARMFAVNPAFIPRNHLIEETIRAAVDRNDFEPFHRLVERLSEPSRYDPADARYAMPPKSDEVVLQTFCGT